MSLRKPILLSAIWYTLLPTIVLSTPANALPTSSCTKDPGGETITCDLFETDAQGKPTERPPIINTPLPVESRFVVFLEKGAPAGQKENVAFWSDVLELNTTFVRLFSDIEGTSNFLPTVPGPGDVNQGLDLKTIYTPEDGDPQFYIDSLGNTFKLHPDAEVPEPSSLTLFGIGALGLLSYSWWRRKKELVGWIGWNHPTA